MTVVWLALTGCAGGPGAGGASSPQTPPGPGPAASDRPAGGAVDGDSRIAAGDPQYHVLVGELRGQRDDIEGAARAYIQAARSGGESALARRATRIALAASNWTLLEQAARVWLEIAPGDAEARQYLAVALAYQDRPADAEAVLAAIVRDSEPRSRGWRRLAKLLGEMPDQAAAGQLVGRLVARDDLGDNADAMYGRSVLAWRFGHRDMARQLALDAARGSERLDILEWAAQVAYASGDIDSALSMYRKALEVEPGDRDLTLAHAEVLKRAGRTDDAIARLRELGDVTAGLYTRAAYQLDAGRRQQAEALLARLQALPDPDASAEHAFYTAQLAEMLDRPGQALDWYSKVTSGDYRVQARLREAELTARRGRVEAAQTMLQGLQNDRDRDTVVRAFLAESAILQEAGQAEAAVQRLSAALTRYQTDVDLLYARALAAAAQGDVGLAEQDLRRIIQMNPDNAAALNALGYTLTDLTDRHDEAYQLISKALELNPEDAAILDSMGWVHYRRGNTEQALEFLRKAYERDDNAEIAAHFGEVLWRLGQRARAREVFAAARERDAGHPVLQSTLERLGVAP